MLRLLRLTVAAFCLVILPWPLYAYYTTAHKIIELENTLTGQQKGTEVLNEIIEEAITEIDLIKAQEDKINKRTATSILQAVARVLKNKNFTHQSTDLLSSALSYCTEDACYYSDCDTNSYIYYSILRDILGQDVVLVAKHKHMFVRWKFSDKKHINWETTLNEKLNDWEYYYMLNSKHEHELVSSEQVISSVYYTFAIIKSDELKYGEALKLINKAIDMDPLFASYYNERGVIRLKMNDILSAVYDFTYAIMLAPDEGSYYGNRGAAYYSIGNYREALNDFDQAMSRTNTTDYSTIRELSLQKIKLEPVANAK